MKLCKCGCGQEISDASEFTTIAHRNRYLLSGGSIEPEPHGQEVQIVKHSSSSYQGELVGEKFRYNGDAESFGLHTFEEVVVTSQNDDGSVAIRSSMRPSIKIASIPLSFLGRVTTNYSNYLNLDGNQKAAFEKLDRKGDPNRVERMTKSATHQVSPRRAGGKVVVSDHHLGARPSVSTRNVPTTKYAMGNSYEVTDYDGKPIDKIYFTEEDRNNPLFKAGAAPIARNRFTGNSENSFFTDIQADIDYPTSRKVGRNDSYLPEGSVLNQTLMPAPAGVLEDEKAEDSYFAMKTQQEDTGKAAEASYYSKTGLCPRCHTISKKSQTRAAEKEGMIQVWCGNCTLQYKTAAIAFKKAADEIGGIPVYDKKTHFTAEEARARRGQVRDSMDDITRRGGFAGNVRDYENPYAMEDGDYLSGTEQETLGEGYFGAEEEKKPLTEIEKDLYGETPDGTVEPPHRKAKWTDLLGTEEDRWGGR